LCWAGHWLPSENPSVTSSPQILFIFLSLDLIVLMATADVVIDPWVDIADAEGMRLALANPPADVALVLTEDNMAMALFVVRYLRSVFVSPAKRAKATADRHAEVCVCEDPLYTPGNRMGLPAIAAVLHVLHRLGMRQDTRFTEREAGRIRAAMTRATPADGVAGSMALLAHLREADAHTDRPDDDADWSEREAYMRRLESLGLMYTPSPLENVQGLLLYARLPKGHDARGMLWAVSLVILSGCARAMDHPIWNCDGDFNVVLDCLYETSQKAILQAPLRQATTHSILTCIARRCLTQRLTRNLTGYEDTPVEDNSARVEQLMRLPINLELVTRPLDCVDGSICARLGPQTLFNLVTIGVQTPANHDRLCNRTALPVVLAAASQDACQGVLTHVASWGARIAFYQGDRCQDNDPDCTCTQTVLREASAGSPVLSAMLAQGLL